MQISNNMLNFDNEFQQLLATWNAHQTLRDNQAPLSALMQSHQELSTRRLRTAHARANCVKF